ncbi:hypothetical protein D3C79_905510 [compost metagenome]
MAGKGCMVSFKVQLEVFIKVVLLQERDGCCCIEVILVFSRLFRFRLDQELAVITDFLSVVYSHAEQAGNVILLKTHICIQQSFVAFTAAPEYIVV